MVKLVQTEEVERGDAITEQNSMKVNVSPRSTMSEEPKAEPQSPRMELTPVPVLHQSESRTTAVSLAPSDQQRSNAPIQLQRAETLFDEIEELETKEKQREAGIKRASRGKMQIKVTPPQVQNNAGIDPLDGFVDYQSAKPNESVEDSARVTFAQFCSDQGVLDSLSAGLAFKVVLARHGAVQLAQKSTDAIWNLCVWIATRTSFA